MPWGKISATSANLNIQESHPTPARDYDEPFQNDTAADFKTGALENAVIHQCYSPAATSDSRLVSILTPFPHIICRYYFLVDTPEHARHPTPP
jgi:hypothetical protein